MKNINDNWQEIRTLFNKSFFSSFHYAIASVNSDGTPHVSPIGSLLLNKNEPKGVYFEIFVNQLRKNVEINPKICVLATNSSRLFWISSLFLGRFRSKPAIRLGGIAGARRPATPEEINLWQKRIWYLRFLKGYGLLWNELRFVRDVEFTKVEYVNMGRMTARIK